MMTIKNVLAEDLNPGDTIRLQFMGGTEDIEISEVLDIGNGMVRWIGYNMVTGRLEDTVEQNHIIRRVV
jgi:hypothetical protein